MKTTAIRLYGKNDIRLETFDLPEMQDDQILAKVVTDSICMSSYKAAVQGADHKRVPNNVAENPVIVGHEFCGELIKVGKKWQEKFKPGDRFTIQPALNYKGTLDAPGYSYRNIGGGATYILIPNEVMECDCLLPYTGRSFFWGSLSEPMSCIVGAFRGHYHIKPGTHVHDMGTVRNGNMAILAGAGPMGLGAVDYALHSGNAPELLVVTDIDQRRLDRAAAIMSPEKAAESGTRLVFLNTSGIEDPALYVRNLTKDGRGFDDVFVYAPVKTVVEMGDAILARDGCLDFFAGPTDNKFSAMFNFYNVHYNGTHIVGTSGGNTDDMREAISLMSDGSINPACMITHIGGLDSEGPTTLNLPKIPGGKKLIYTHISLPLTAISEFRDRSEEGGPNARLFGDLASICENNGGLWCTEAEDRILSIAEN
jgi:threonine dehydrogenase-like Zn-dependent dehydrogenase